MQSNLPIIDAEFEDIPNCPIPGAYAKPTKKPKSSRTPSTKSAKTNLVGTQLQIAGEKKKAKVDKENPRGRLDLLTKGIIQEQTGNQQLAELAGEFVGLLVGKKVKGPEFQFLAKLMNGGF